jgi:hypothetical protein
MFYFLNFEYSQKIKKTQKENFFNSKTGRKKIKKSIYALFFFLTQFKKVFYTLNVSNFEKQRMFPAEHFFL